MVKVRLSVAPPLSITPMLIGKDPNWKESPLMKPLGSPLRPGGKDPLRMLQV